MLAPLDKGRMYHIGRDEKAKLMLYMGRDFPEDDVPSFEFVEVLNIFNEDGTPYGAETSTHVISFTLDQLTQYEKDGCFVIGEKVGLRW